MNWIGESLTTRVNKPCLVAESGSLSYADLRRHVGQIGRRFAERGWSPGTRIFLAATDDRHALCLTASAIAHGLVPVMADPASPPAAAAILRQVADTRAAVVDTSLAENWGFAGDREIDLWQIRPERPRGAGQLYNRLLRRAAAPAEGLFAELDAVSGEAPSWQPTPAAPAIIFYTSGSTARPKAVELSHGALATHLATLARQFSYETGSRIINLLPWNHVDGFIHGPLAALAAGATLHRPLPFRIANAQRIVDSLYVDRITHFIAVPTMLAILLRLADGLRDAFEAPDLRSVISTAGYLEESLWRNFEARFGINIANVYGLTETVSGGLFSGPDAMTRRVGTLGRPVDCDIRIVDPKQRTLNEGETGELWLSGANLMTGYLGEPEATADVLRDGWLKTGDLVWRDSEGFIHFAGRLKNMLVSGGHTIQPEEVTAALKLHPAVADASTIGLPHAELEEVAVAAVVLAPGASTSETILADHCRHHLAAYKIPRRIAILKELPYGPSGKVRNDALRNILQDVRPADESRGPATEVLEIARRCFRSPVDLSAASTPEMTPGWDSMAHLEFVMALEEAFAIRLSSQDIMNVTSLGAAIAIVERARDHG
jgi:long-chain acyl-CoA synthetase